MGTVYISDLDAFELYHKVREENNKSGDSFASSHFLRSIGDGLAGSAGASISNVITYPIDLIITRLQIQRQLRKNAQEAGEDEYTGLFDAANKIYNKEGGLTGFYAGVLSDTGKTIADSFVFFLLYDYLRGSRLRRSGGKSSLPAHEELSVGFVAGAVTKLLTTPIANVATRQKASALSNRHEKAPSFMEIGRRILAEEGPIGFWSGYSASLVLTLNPSLTFFLFEFFKRLTLPKSRREHSPPAVTFFLAALSKSCASSVTYPFSLTKTCLQAGSVNNKKAEEEESKTVDESIHSENKSIEKAEKKVVKKTLLTTLMTIYKSEGPSALYEGLHLEILKAFLSHGITMSMKQFVTRFLGKLSYTLSIIFANYTSKAGRQASRLAERAKDQSVGYYDLSIKRVNEKVQEAVDAAKGKAHEVAEFVHEYVDEEDSEGWKDLYGTTGLAKWLDERFKESADLEE